MSKDVDKTIKRIETDLEGNKQSLPKSAPTQHGIDCPPSEMPLYLLKADCTHCNFSLTYEFSDLDLVNYQLYLENARKHCCVHNRHKVKFVVGSLVDAEEMFAGEISYSNWWKRLLEKFQFVLIACVISVIFACFEGWHTLPLRFPCTVFGAWMGEWSYKKWIKPKLQRSTDEQT